MKYLWLLLLTGCATHGMLDYGQAVDYKEIKCENVEPYYLDVATRHNFETGEQQINISWQCGDSDRRYIYLDKYNPLEVFNHDWENN